MRDPTIRLVLNGLRREASIEIDEAAGGNGPHAARRRISSCRPVSPGSGAAP